MNGQLTGYAFYRLKDMRMAYFRERILQMALYKGIFWIAGDIRHCFRIPCDVRGKVVGQAEYPLNSKDGLNYNHKMLWANLPKSITGGNPFDYYPRGRVEIRNAKAIVYLHPDINTNEIQSLISDSFGLKNENGITSVRFISDGSDHYRYQM